VIAWVIAALGSGREPYPNPNADLMPPSKAI